MARFPVGRLVFPRMGFSFTYHDSGSQVSKLIRCVTFLNMILEQFPGKDFHIMDTALTTKLAKLYEKELQRDA